MKQVPSVTPQSEGQVMELRIGFRLSGGKFQLHQCSGKHAHGQPESKPKAAPTSSLNLSETAPIMPKKEPCQHTLRVILSGEERVPCLGSWLTQKRFFF